MHSIHRLFFKPTSKRSQRSLRSNRVSPFLLKHNLALWLIVPFRVHFVHSVSFYSKMCMSILIPLDFLFGLSYYRHNLISVQLWLFMLCYCPSSVGSRVSLYFKAIFSYGARFGCLKLFEGSQDLECFRLISSRGWCRQRCVVDEEGEKLNLLPHYGFNVFSILTEYCMYVRYTCSWRAVIFFVFSSTLRLFFLIIFFKPKCVPLGQNV